MGKRVEVTGHVTARLVDHRVVDSTAVVHVQSVQQFSLSLLFSPQQVRQALGDISLRHFCGQGSRLYVSKASRHCGHGSQMLYSLQNNSPRSSASQLRCESHSCAAVEPSRARIAKKVPVPVDCIFCVGRPNGPAKDIPLYPSLLPRGAVVYRE